MSTPTDDLVPEATPAAPDLICWLWAAFPPRNGRLHVARIAEGLGVSASTIRRWVREAARLQLNDEGMLLVKRRAILRGRGRYLWPDLDPTSRQRQHLQARYAARVDYTIRTTPEQRSPTWSQNGTLEEHTVALVHYPKAHAYGVSTARSAKSLQRLQRTGVIMQATTVSNKYAAVVLKHHTLTRVDSHRCLVPRELVPSGRTETWRETGGVVRLRRLPGTQPGR